MTKKKKSYQVLARKYRPQSFDEAIGQGTITTTLKNAITGERLHHAYLFTGPRGIGKTSLARIFAKCLNCEQGPAITPCQSCVPCQEITAGSSLDVQEIDGASNTSVDDIRSLRSNAKYRPTARFKIYIIDEVHMLSKSAWAALLKTLEEPPEHVRFIFATTDVDKIPPTILSRVLRFDFHRPTVELLVQHLKNIAGQEKISVDDEALLLIARQADGSVRDALSLLDRVVSYGGDTITNATVRDVLGLQGNEATFALLEVAIKGDVETAIGQIQTFYNEGIDLEQFGSQFLQTIRNVLLFKLVGVAGIGPATDAEQKSIAMLAELTNEPDLEYLFHLFHRAYQEILTSPMPKMMLEIAIIRLCTRTKREVMTQVLEKLNQGSFSTANQAPASSVEETKPIQKSLPPQNNPPKKSVSERVASQEATSSHKTINTWNDFLEIVRREKPALASVLAHAVPASETKTHITLHAPTNPIHRDLFQDPERQSAAQQLAQKHWARELIFDSTVAPETAKTLTKNSIIDDAVSIFKPQKTDTVQKRT